MSALSVHGVRARSLRNLSRASVIRVDAKLKAELACVAATLDALERMRLQFLSDDVSSDTQTDKLSGDLVNLLKLD